AGGAVGRYRRHRRRGPAATQPGRRRQRAWWYRWHRQRRRERAVTTIELDAYEPGHAGGDHPVIEVTGVTKVYGTGEAAVHALRGVSLTVERGEYVAVMGSSGSGKSTLMNVIGCLD